MIATNQTEPWGADKCGPLSSLLYVSRSVIPSPHAEHEIERIVATSRTRNRAMEVTGALLFTGTYFAQVLEGRTDMLETLMERISSDPRHEQIMMVDRAPAERRRFAEWSLAYAGPSQFVSRHVSRLFEDPVPSNRRRAAYWLTELLREFSAFR